MIRLIAKLWRIFPYPIRLKIVRLTQPKFTVSVVALVFNAEGEVLILDHYIRPGATWGLPGGFIDPDELPEEAIRRELKEETSLDLENIVLLQIRTIGKHIEILYKATAVGEVELKEREIRDFGWFSSDSLPRGVSKKQREIINAILEGSIS